MVCPRIGRLTSTVASRMQQVDLVRASDDAVLAFWREVEVQTRRLAAVDHRVIASVEERGLAGLGAYASTAALARDVLRIAPGEATARVDAAHRLGPRWSPSQPVLPAQFPDTAAAIAQGAVSARHAAVVTARSTSSPTRSSMSWAAGCRATCSSRRGWRIRCCWLATRPA
jgi:hypothetical protein